MPHSCRAVAQISNLLYRRIPFGRPPDYSNAHEFSEACGLKIRDTAGWKPALRAFSPGKTEALPTISGALNIGCHRAPPAPNHEEAGMTLREVGVTTGVCPVRWQKEFGEQMEELRHALGADPNLDIFPTRYRPDVPHAVVPQPEGEYRVFRIMVNGVLVRFVEDSHRVQMTVEGILPQSTADLLASDVRDKLASLENTRYELRQITNL